jgi:hypothetical protein
MNKYRGFNENACEFKAGQKGTKRLVEQYGDALICVRYRYDAKTQKQYKTVEIIVSETEWTPPPAKYPDGTMVSLKIGMEETALQKQVRAVGGRWDKPLNTSQECCGISLISSLQLTAAAYLRSISRDGE